MEKLDPRSTALVLIDLQKGILGFAGGPYTGDQVVESAAKMARRFREVGAPVVLVRVGFSEGFVDALRQPVDQSLSGGGPLPANWWEIPAELEVADNDIHITKRQWGAFYGTELDLQLRRRGITTIVLCGISTNHGVESTARNAWEHGYNLIVAEDASSAPSTELHRFSVDNIMPRLGRVRSTAQILEALS
jgi:nicotinamidase-related amidase